MGLAACVAAVIWLAYALHSVKSRVDAYNSIEVGWTREAVLARAGEPTVERNYDPNLDTWKTKTADQVLIYHIPGLIGSGKDWLFYLESGKVVDVIMHGPR